jgi:hypothetical protein
VLAENALELRLQIAAFAHDGDLGGESICG